MKMRNIVVIALLALIPIVIAQNPIDAVTGSLQEQINTAGQQLRRMQPNISWKEILHKSTSAKI